MDDERERRRERHRRRMADPVNRQRHRDWNRQYQRWKAARRRLPEAIAWFDANGSPELASIARELLAAIDEYRP